MRDIVRKLDRIDTIRVPLDGRDPGKRTGLYEFAYAYAGVNHEFASVVHKIKGLDASAQTKRGIGLRALQRSGLSTLFFRDIWPTGNMLNSPGYKDHRRLFIEALKEGDRYLASSMLGGADILGSLDIQFYGF